MASVLRFLVRWAVGGVTVSKRRCDRDRVESSSSRVSRARRAVSGVAQPSATSSVIACDGARRCASARAMIVVRAPQLGDISRARAGTMLTSIDYDFAAPRAL